MDDQTPRWARRTLVASSMVISLLSGALIGITTERVTNRPDAVPASSEASPNPRTYQQISVKRNLAVAVREDLGLSLDQWYDQAAQITRGMEEVISRGGLPVRIEDGRVLAREGALDEPTISNALGLITQSAEDVPPPATGDPDDWLCSPGVSLRIHNRNSSEPRHIDATFTAQHCFDPLGDPSGDEDYMPPVLSDISTRTDGVLPSDIGPEEEGSDVGITTRHVTPNEGPHLEGKRVHGLSPMVPGMQVCSHGLSSGWRCGLVLDGSQASNEGVTAHPIGMASASGDSGGRVIHGQHAVGTVSSFTHIPREDEDAPYDITHTRSGSLFDAAMIARSRGFQIEVLR